MIRNENIVPDYARLILKRAPAIPSSQFFIKVHVVPKIFSKILFPSPEAEVKDQKHCWWHLLVIDNCGLYARCFLFSVFLSRLFPIQRFLSPLETAAKIQETSRDGYFSKPPLLKLLRILITS